MCSLVLSRDEWDPKPCGENPSAGTHDGCFFSHFYCSHKNAASVFFFPLILSIVLKAVPLFLSLRACALCVCVSTELQRLPGLRDDRVWQVPRKWIWCKASVTRMQKVAQQRHVKHSCLHEALCWCFCRRTAGCVTAREPSWMNAAITAMAKAKRGGGGASWCGRSFGHFLGCL